MEEGGGSLSSKIRLVLQPWMRLKTCVGCLKWSLSLAFVSLEVKRTL